LQVLVAQGEQQDPRGPKEVRSRTEIKTWNLTDSHLHSD
jgi:hypothetical protein